MKNIVGKIVILVLIVSSITACASKLSYKKDSGDPASPGDKELVFSLRNSTILISQSGTEKKADDGKKATDQPDLTTPVNSCPERKGEKPIIPSITYDNCLRSCLSGVTAKAAAARDTSAFYVAQPAWGTTLSSTAVDNDPFMVKKITVDYKNPMTGVVSSAGAGAVAGFGIGGPWGAAIGGLLGAATRLAAGMIPKKWYEENVCKEDREPDSERFEELEQKPANNTNVPQLFLPVALPYETSKSETVCWHPLPNRSPEAQEAEIQPATQGLPPLSGWFYRIIAVNPKASDSKLPPVLPTVLPNLERGEKLSPPFQKRDEYFRFAGNHETFPVSACRSVEVQITWWEMLAKMDAPVIKYHKYPMMVAASDYVQAIRLPKNGTVNLLPVCGGYASPTQSSSSLGEVIDAVVKQAQAVKEAQTKYKEKEEKDKQKDKQK
jgi:hypothetical protein